MPENIVGVTARLTRSFGSQVHWALPRSAALHPWVTLGGKSSSNPQFAPTVLNVEPY